MGAGLGLVVAFCLPFIVPTWCRWCRVQGLPVSCGVCPDPFSLPFVPLSLLLSCNSPQICPISHFKGVLAGFPLLDVCLYCSGALRGLRGFCVREWLGGFGACGVFAPYFSSSLPSFYPFFIFFVLLLSLCSCCPLLVLLPALFVLVFLFSFSLSVRVVVGLICKIATRAVRLYICYTVFRCDFATIAKIHKIRDVCKLSYSVKSESLCLAPEL